MIVELRKVSVMKRYLYVLESETLFYIRKLNFIYNIRERKKRSANLNGKKMHLNKNKKKTSINRVYSKTNVKMQ